MKPSKNLQRTTTLHINTRAMTILRITTAIARHPHTGEQVPLIEIDNGKIISGRTPSMDDVAEIGMVFNNLDTIGSAGNPWRFGISLVFMA